MLKKLVGKIKGIVNRLFKVSTLKYNNHPTEYITIPYHEGTSITCVGGGGSGGTDTHKDLKIVDAPEKPSDVFNAALDYLWDGIGKARCPLCLEAKHTFICRCIDISSRTNTVKIFCKDIIKERLGGSDTLSEWLVSNKHATWVELQNNSAKIQETRRQWLISLRDEFKAKGM